MESEKTWAWQSLCNICVYVYIYECILIFTGIYIQYFILHNLLKIESQAEQVV
jgi:hypothetical protein